MKKRLLNIFVFLASFVFLPNFTFGCSLAYAKVSQFPKHIYVFTGEILGYSDKFESKKVHGQAYGLKIKSIDVLNAPNKTKDFYEVFQFGLEADCSPIGYDLDRLKELFPIGSKVSVMAIEATIFDKVTQTGQIRLEARSLLGVGRNDIEGQYSFSTNSIFNYANSKFQGSGILQLELYKDLLRIEKAKTHANKIRVLNRLVYFQEYWLDFESLLRQHLDSKTAQKLNSKRKAFLKKKFNTK